MQTAKKQGGGIGGFDVQKTGNARVGLVGFPSVGKSSILVKLTSAKSAVDEQQKALASMETLFSQTTAFFAQMYNAVKPYYDMPDLKDTNSPTCILQGLENIMHGITKMAQELAKSAPAQE